jgi:hypothetical protein
MRLEPSLSDFAISHQLNSVRGAGSRKSQFLKNPVFHAIRLEANSPTAGQRGR